MLNYSDAPPIEPRPCSAWLVELPDGRKFLHLCAADMTLEAVHELIKMHHPQFIMKSVWVGDFEVAKVESAYVPDGREVDQDLNLATRLS